MRRFLNTMPGDSVVAKLDFKNAFNSIRRRVVHGSDGPAGRVGSGQHFGFLSVLLIISWYLNRYESSNTAFGLIDFIRYLI